MKEVNPRVRGAFCNVSDQSQRIVCPHKRVTYSVMLFGDLFDATLANKNANSKLVDAVADNRGRR